MNKTDLEILDCTVRDGGYVNNWDFDKKLVRETYRALSKSGIDYAELGYHGSAKYFPADKFGRFRFSSAADINDVCAGINGAKVALMVDHGKFDLADLAQYRDTPVRMIRLAFHKDKLEEALRSLVKIKELGFTVSANLMGFVNYTEQDRAQALSMLRDLPIDYAYVADSYGSMFPEQVAEFFEPLKEIKHVRWGFHPHNNLQMSFANSLAAIKAGARIIDSSVFGMGRGAGNLPTEILLAYVQRWQPDKYNVIPVLNLIDRFYNDLHREKGWGYNLPYMLSGNYGCHPDYARNLVERKEYDIEDIWNILEAVTNQTPVGYKSALIEEVLRKGIYGRRSKSAARKEDVRPANGRPEKITYLDRHKGRDFLILTNGPTLKQFQPEIKAFIDKYDPVVMGGNYLGGLFTPHYRAPETSSKFPRRPGRPSGSRPGRASRIVFSPSYSAFYCSLAHLIISARPSFSPVRAEKPNSFRILPASP